jgi:hypothetical protein
MPSTPHEAPLELLRQNPMLAAILLRQAGVRIRRKVSARTGPTDLTVVTTKQFLADNVTILETEDGKAAWATVNEPQLGIDASKRWSWPVYLTTIRARLKCPATLLVFCYDKKTADWARQPIDIGHPGFRLRPVIIDADNTPDPDDPTLSDFGAELAVLAAHTGALDLADPEMQDLVVAKITPCDAERVRLYASFILNIAPDNARRDLEVKMATAGFPIHPVADRFANTLARLKDQATAEGKAEGKAAGETEMLLRIAAKRGIDIDQATRARVLACTDEAVIADWADRVLTGGTATEIFTS